MNNFKQSESALGVTDEVAKETPGNHKTLVTASAKDGTSVSQSLTSLTAISGVVAQIHGAVTIDNVTIRWVPFDSGCQLNFVLFKTGGTVTSKDFFTKPNAVCIVSNQFNCGQMQTIRPGIPEGLARQISPASGVYPGVSFYLEVKGKAQTAVDFELGVHGPRFIVTSF